MSGAGHALAAERLVAHRGWPARFPENTVLGITAAIEQGARFFELDVQLTADGVPIIFHDESLARSCGRDALVTQTRFADLPSDGASFPNEYGDRFADRSIDRLETLGHVIAEHPDVQAFVEVKPESARHFGRQPFFSAVERVLRGFDRGSVAAVISKDAGLCELAKAHAWQIGWVLPDWTEANRLIAQQLAAEYLFGSVDQLPSHPESLWEGPWNWVAYTVNEAKPIAQWLEYGIHLVETDDIGLLA